MKNINFCLWVKKNSIYKFFVNYLPALKPSKPQQQEKKKHTKALVLKESLSVSPLADYYLYLLAQRLEAVGCIITCQGSPGRGWQGAVGVRGTWGPLAMSCWAHKTSSVLSMLQRPGTWCGIHLVNVLDVALHPATSWHLCGYLCTTVTGPVRAACGPGDFSIIC